MKDRFYLKSCLFLAVLLAGAAPLAGQQVPDADDMEASVDSIFSAFDGPNQPGAAVAVWQDGKIAFSKGYGSANVEYGIPVTPDETIFHVASVSKQFTVYAILLLQADGKLSLDDPIRKHIPEVPDFGTPITLRHLASHTSGMRDQWSLLQMAGWRMDDVITVDHILKLVERQKDLNFQPGEEFNYCNTGFTLLAETVARTSGLTFAEFTEERIFEPLGLEHTLFYDDHEKIVPNRAYSYYRENDVLKKAVLSFANAGATSLFTTAEDLVRWADHLNNPPSKKVEEMVAQMDRLAVLNNGETFGGAYGQFISPYKGLKQIQHGGADAGYRSYLGRFPEQDFAVAVVSNYADSGPNRLALQVADLFLKDHIEEQEEGPVPPEPPTIAMDEDALRAFEGYYWFDEQQTYRRIYLKDGYLMYHRAGGAENRIAPIGPNQFKMLDIGVNAVVEFTEENQGRVMTFKDPGGEITRMASFDYVEGDPDLFERYAGTYYSPELDTSYQLVVENGKLMARHNRLPDVPLSLIRGDRFSIGPYSAQFKKNPDGEISAMLVTTGRIRDLVFEKQ